jgi:kinesin family protein 2/24
MSKKGIKHQKSKKGVKEEIGVGTKTNNENPNWELHSMIKNYRESNVFHPIGWSHHVKSNRITVCIRKRPLNEKEIASNEVDVISVPTKEEIIVHREKIRVDLSNCLVNKHFEFDYAFDETCSNGLVYRYTVKPLVKNIFKGLRSTCFVYGQAGSGKTRTMFGDNTDDRVKGICTKAAEDAFMYFKRRFGMCPMLKLCASFFEIHCGEVFDLLANKAKLRVLQDSKLEVQVVGLTDKVVHSLKEFLELLDDGVAARSSAETSENPYSSRSHAVFQIVARRSGTNTVYGKLSLVDLAGNDTGDVTSPAKYNRRTEGSEINKSLLALKECIRALSGNSAHIPFRDNKLTQILKDSFLSKNSRTCVIGMICPGISSRGSTISTLRFADHLKEKKKKIKEELVKHRQQLREELQEHMLENPRVQYRLAMKLKPIQWLLTVFRLATWKCT